MTFDWFTFVAQVVNFIILMGLLHYFLYRPITRVMDEREQGIAERLREAEAKMEEAEKRVRTYEEKIDQLERERENLLGEAREQAREKRKQLVEQAREEVRTLRSNWRENLRRDREMFLRELRRRAAQEVSRATRKLLRDLAAEDLQKQVVRVFLDRVRSLDEEQVQLLRQSLDEEEPEMVVQSAYDLDAEDRSKLKDAIFGRWGRDMSVQFETDSELVCGIELRCGGRKIAWNVQEYLDELQQQLEVALEEEAEEIGEATDVESALREGA